MLWKIVRKSLSALVKSFTQKTWQTGGYDLVRGGPVIVFDSEIPVCKIRRIYYSKACTIIAVTGLTDAANVY